MWKMIFAVVAVSSLAFGEPTGLPNHGDPAVLVNQTPVASSPGNSPNLQTIENACSKLRRSGTNGPIATEDLAKAATSR